MKKRGRIFSLLALCFIALLLLLQFSLADEATSSLTVNSQNVAPVLLTAIPNQTWAINTNLTGAFDLDDYFIDNETITYNASSVQNISVEINSSTNVVSFFPDIGFEGIRNVTFIATDSESASRNSNLVFLNVTNDTIPPTWSDPQKDLSEIFQNSIVNFSANWADNIGLSHFIFAIKQESGWVNQSNVTFSGISNISAYAIQISAPGGTTVSWQFFGFDTSGNMNLTDEQNFTVSSVSGSGSSSSDSSSSSSSSTSTSTTATTATGQSFTVDPPEGFLIDIKQGSSGIITIEVTNTGDTDLDFEISIAGLSEFDIIISEESFTLAPGESKAVTIEFNAGERLLPDLYYGDVNIKTNNDFREIPVVIALKAIEIDYDLSVEIPEEYKEVRPNSEVRANLTLENLEDVKERNVTLYYSITDFEGNIIDSRFEEFSFSQRSVTLERLLDIPAEITKGDYIFFARAVSEDEIAIDSDVFTVGERFNLASFLRTNLVLILIILSAVIVAFLMVRYRRSREKLRILNLYLMVSELDKLMKQGKHDEAIDIYVRIKSAYGEPVSQTTLQNKEELKQEMDKLLKKLNSQVTPKPLQENKEGEKKEDKKGAKGKAGEKTGETKTEEKTVKTKSDEKEKKDEQEISEEQKIEKVKKVEESIKEIGKSDKKSEETSKAVKKDSTKSTDKPKKNK